MSNNLYKELISSRLKKGQNGEEFWGIYDSLDNVNIPDSTLFLKEQIKNLQILEKNEKYTATNMFLQQAGIGLVNHETTIEEKVSQDVFARIIELMNAGLKGSSINPFKGIKGGLKTAEGRQIATQKINNIILELKQLLKQINTNGSLSANIVSMLEKRLNVDTWNWGDTPHSYIMEKADLVEALMVDKINQNPALRAIVTGAWIDMGGQQLIEDAFAFNKTEISIPFSCGSLKFYIKTGKGAFKEKAATSIKDFLDQLEQVSNTDFKVKVSDELYEALKIGSQIAGQAKSGMVGQAILNKNVRNSLTLEEIHFDPRLLWDLYEKDMAVKTQYFKDEKKQNSKDLEALANYCLSKNIALTALKANQLYLTAEGFVTASQWMQLNKRYLIFNPAIRSISNDFLTKSRPYFFID